MNCIGSRKGEVKCHVKNQKDQKNGEGSFRLKPSGLIEYRFTYKDEFEYVKWKLKSAKMDETTKDYVMDCFERYAMIENFDPTFTINYIIINLITNS